MIIADGIIRRLQNQLEAFHLHELHRIVQKRVIGRIRRELNLRAVTERIVLEGIVRRINHFQHAMGCTFKIVSKKIIVIRKRGKISRLNGRIKETVIPDRIVRGIHQNNGPCVGERHVIVIHMIAERAALESNAVTADWPRIRAVDQRIVQHIIIPGQGVQPDGIIRMVRHGITEQRVILRRQFHQDTIAGRHENGIVLQCIIRHIAAENNAIHRIVDDIADHRGKPGAVGKSDGISRPAGGVNDGVAPQSGTRALTHDLDAIVGHVLDEVV